MPIEKIAGRILPIPVPLDTFPESGDVVVKCSLFLVGAVEILASGEKPLHQERCFHQVATIVECSKNRHGSASASVHVVRPCAVVALCPFQESHDLGKPLNSLLSSDEAALHADYQRSNSKTASAGRDHAIIPG